MELYTLNHTYEIIEDEDNVILFDKNMTIIYSCDSIGKIILECFNTPIDINTVKKQLESKFNNIKEDELIEFFDILKEKNIIIKS